MKVIDPTGRVCQTDVLAGWPSYGRAEARTDVQYDVPREPASPPPSIMVAGIVTGSRVAGRASEHATAVRAADR